MAEPIDPGERLEGVIAALVADGRYPSREKALRASVMLLEERERKLVALHAAIAEGLADAEAGRIHSAQEVFDHLEAKYLAMAEAKGE